MPRDIELDHIVKFRAISLRYPIQVKCMHFNRIYLAKQQLRRVLKSLRLIRKESLVLLLIVESRVRPPNICQQRRVKVVNQHMVSVANLCHMRRVFKPYPPHRIFSRQHRRVACRLELESLIDIELQNRYLLLVIPHQCSVALLNPVVPVVVCCHVVSHRDCPIECEISSDQNLEEQLVLNHIQILISELHHAP